MISNNIIQNTFVHRSLLLNGFFFFHFYVLIVGRVPIACILPESTARWAVYILPLIYSLVRSLYRARRMVGHRFAPASFWCSHARRSIETAVHHSANQSTLIKLSLNRRRFVHTCTHWRRFSQISLGPKILNALTDQEGFNRSWNILRGLSPRNRPLNLHCTAISLRNSKTILRLHCFIFQDGGIQTKYGFTIYVSPVSRCGLS